MENVDDDTNADDNGDADGNGDADDDPVVAPVDGWHFIDPPGCPGRSKDGRVAKPSKTQEYPSLEGAAQLTHGSLPKQSENSASFMSQRCQRTTRVVEELHGRTTTSGRVFLHHLILFHHPPLIGVINFH